MPRKNDWAMFHGPRRRAIDRAILAECERAIALEEQGLSNLPKIETPLSAAFPADPERERIARAFGRPVH